MQLYPYKKFCLNGKKAIFGAGFVADRPPHTESPEHEMQSYDCSILIQGRGLLIDEAFNSFPLTAGSGFQHFPGTGSNSFHLDLTQPWLEFRMSFNQETSEALQTISGFHHHAPVFRVELYPHLRRWMLELASNLMELSDGVRLDLYFELQRLLLTVHLQEDDSDFARALSVIHFACDIVMKNLKNPPTIQELSESCGVSREKFSAIFKSYTGMSPLRFLHHYKFCYADRLLHDGMQIRNVADLFGYSDQFSFSKQFKKSMGISPSECQRAKTVPEWDGQSDPKT